MIYKNELWLFPLSLLLVACSSNLIYVNPSMHGSPQTDLNAALLRADGICTGTATGIETPQTTRSSAGFIEGLTKRDDIVTVQGKNQIYVGCMASQGWYLAEDKEEIKNLLSSPNTEQAENKRQSLDAVFQAVENTEHLRDWLHNKDEKEKLEYAINLECAIKNKSPWKYKSLEDRLKFVTNMTIIHFSAI